MGLKLFRLLLAAGAVVMVLVAPAPASGQGAALSCTASLVTSFTPCLDFITNGTASPTADCCRSLGALVNASTGCACLILTGNMPLGVPMNRTLVLTLPKACNSMSVPLQCQDTLDQIPAADPVADAPSLPQLPPATPGPEALAPPAEPTVTPPVSQGQTRPMVVPSSVGTASSHVHATVAFLLSHLEPRWCDRLVISLVS